MHTLARTIVLAAGLWTLLGVVFALFFVTLGVQRVDPLARGAGIGFRVVIVPGVIVFWPLLTRRWASGASEPPTESNPHRRAARLAHGAPAKRATT